MKFKSRNLREIAETLSLHESTISRVTTQKYMATPRGTYELKYFFGSHVATDSGGAASATAIPTDTPFPTAMATASFSATPTATATDTPTSTATQSATPTRTASPTS